MPTTRYWTGAGSTVSQVDTLLVGSSTVGHTFIVTINGKDESYTAVTGDTTDTIAAALLAVLQASDEGEFTELTFEADTSNTSKITVTGPTDGAPFTMSVSGTGTLTHATPTSPLSPHDYNRAANWSGTTLPTTGDAVVFDSGSVDVRYNLDQNTDSLGSWTRLPTYTGIIGLPDVNEAGAYREYRARHVEVKCQTIRIEQATGDQSGQIRLRGTHASATTVNVVGAGDLGSLNQPGQFIVEVYGLPASSILNLVGASVGFVPFAGQTGTAATLKSINSSLYVGATATLTTVSVTGGSAQFDAGFTTLTLDGNGTVIAGQAAAAATGITIQSGTVSWRSTGTTGTILIGSGATFDASDAPASFTVGTITRRPGSTLSDPAGRITKNYTVAYPDCTMSECPSDFGTGFTLTVAP